MTTHTTQTANAAGPIVALDLGKYKSVACLWRAADDQQFTTLPTNRAELTRLFARHRPAVVLIEACLLCGWVRDLCQELGLECLVANTTSEAWKFKVSVRRTTGRGGGTELVRGSGTRAARGHGIASGRRQRGVPAVRQELAQLGLRHGAGAEAHDQRAQPGEGVHAGLVAARRQAEQHCRRAAAGVAAGK